MIQSAALLPFLRLAKCSFAQRDCKGLFWLKLGVLGDQYRLFPGLHCGVFPGEFGLFFVLLLL